MSEPKISVVMPAYNAEKYITKAIDSILAQTFSNFEFIIINDASIDSTKEIIESYKDFRIKLINNDQNQGVAESLNIGISAAKGQYIARMDADDISLPERFQKQVDFMEKNPDIDVCGSWAKKTENANEIIKNPSSYEDIKDTLFFSCSMSHSTILFKRSLNFQYSSEFPRAEDYDLWCKKINDLKFFNIPEILLLYRVHNNQVGSAHQKEQNNNAKDIRARNLKNIGVNLSEKELKIYNDFFSDQFIPQNIDEVVTAINIFEKISAAGKNFGYGEKFQELIKGFQRKITDLGIKNRITSLILYFTTFKKMSFLDTPRANLRYVYHCLKNIWR